MPITFPPIDRHHRTNTRGYVISMPSFLAALNTQAQQGGSPVAGTNSAGQTGQSTYTGVGVDWVQYFATGTSATKLANKSDVRSILLKQSFPPAAIVGVMDSNPNAACVRE